MLKALANVKETQPAQQAGDTPPVILKAGSSDKIVEVAPKDKTPAKEISKEVVQQAKEAVKPMMLAQEEKAKLPEEPAQQETLTRNVTVISERFGEVDVLKAKLIAEELPHNEGQGASADEIARLNSKTATLSRGQAPAAQHALT